MQIKKIVLIIFSLHIIGEIISRENGSIHKVSNNEVNRELHFTVKNTPLFTISKYLVGMHIVYATSNDRIYEDGSVVKWLKNTGVNTMRFPGGTVIKTWDWKNPSGHFRKDPWDSKWSYDKQSNPASWMSLDEYLDILDKTGMTPLFGVNITSGFVYKKEKESIARAVEMLKYVKKRGYSGAFWYLGNEGMNGGGVSEAGIFKRHVKAMKAIDPDIKCMFNHNKLSDKYLIDYLKRTNGLVDIAETHGKYPYGGKGKKSVDVKEWQQERPLRDRKNGENGQRNEKIGRAWRYTSDSLRDAAKKAGYPNLLIANNEYGLGDDHLTGFNKYTKSLVMIDMLQEHFIGNWFMACFWSMNRGKDSGLIAEYKNGLKLNPMHFGFELLSKAQGGEMLNMEDQGDASTYGFAAKKGDEYLVYILNKSSSTRKVNLSFDSSFSGVGHFKFLTGKTMIDTKNHFGKLIDNNMKKESNNSFSIELPELSYSLFTFKSTH